jgi:hypothetical protein
MRSIDSLIFVVVFALETGALNLQYSVENRGSAEVFLVNMLTRYEEGRGWKPDPSIAYIYLRPTGDIEITKRVPPPPERLVVALRNYYVTPLSPGRAFQEKLRFPLPLTEIHPYESIVGKLPKAITMTVDVQFVLGVVPAEPGLVAKRRTVLDVETYELKSSRATSSSKPPPLITPAEQYLKSARQTLTIPVISLPARP